MYLAQYVCFIKRGNAVGFENLISYFRLSVGTFYMYKDFYVNKQKNYFNASGQSDV